MGRRAVALDSDVMTYLMQANTAGYDPARDPDREVAPERQAAFMIFLHVDPVVVLPTVKRQIARIPDADLRVLHQGFLLVHLEEPQLDEASVATRARDLWAKSGPVCKRCYDELLAETERGASSQVVEITGPAPGYEAVNAWLLAFHATQFTPGYGRLSLKGMLDRFPWVLTNNLDVVFWLKKGDTTRVGSVLVA